MLKLEDICQNDIGEWSILLSNGVEFCFSNQDNPPSEETLKLVENIISKLDELVARSLDYIDIWVDRDRPDIGRKYELYAVLMMTGNKEVKLEFNFPEDEMSEWWVLFIILYYNESIIYSPVSFGRNQIY
ncbi:MAG: hypothetical protein KAF91_32305 [Nostoc sp. TH1S01]|nr:hypothetical protein [Nostoc sp. TH1S01]